MKWNTLHRASLLTLIFVVLNGCAVTEQFKRNYQEASEAYYAPEKLEGNTQDTGILLVDAVTKKSLNTMPLSGVAIVNVREPSKEIVFGSFKTGGLLSQMSGVVVVPNLQPGTYKIVKIKTQNVNMWETLYMPETKEFEIEIAAGKPIYFGQIQVKHPFASTDREIHIQYDKKREATSWKVVVDKYSDSPWVQTIAAHIKSLE